MPAKNPHKRVRIDLGSDGCHSYLASSLADPIYQAQSLHLIANLCTALQEVAEGRGVVGFLEVRGEQRRFDMHAVKRYPQVQGNDHTVRLSDLVGPKSKPVYHLDWFDRRYLALCLASTSLQLYDTAWLRATWSGSDILFRRDLGPDRHPLIKQPFVSRSFAAQRQLGSIAEPAACTACPVIRNSTIFALGIVLIELCFRKPLQSLRVAADLDADGKPTKLTDFYTASRMIDRVRSKAGAPWADAVRRCIYCEFDQHDTSLENEAFRQAVYQGVVKPLEDDLRHYCGGELPDDG